MNVYYDIRYYLMAKVSVFIFLLSRINLLGVQRKIVKYPFRYYIKIYRSQVKMKLYNLPISKVKIKNILRKIYNVPLCSQNIYGMHA